jgi:hypothetical protein
MAADAALAAQVRESVAGGCLTDRASRLAVLRIIGVNRQGAADMLDIASGRRLRDDDDDVDLEFRPDGSVVDLRVGGRARSDA